jgi:holo-[acyl-carrier protein] synthase
MADGTTPLTRCGIDTVEIARVERFLLATPHEDLLRIFSKEELCDVGDGPGRTASLAARFAAKEACLKLFPRETALGLIDPADFALARDGYGAPRVVCSPRALALIARYRLTAIAVSLTHDKTSASAMAVAEPASGQISSWVRSRRPRRPAGPARRPIRPASSP